MSASCRLGRRRHKYGFSCGEGHLAERRKGHAGARAPKPGTGLNLSSGAA